MDPAHHLPHASVLRGSLSARSANSPVRHRTENSCEQASCSGLSSGSPLGQSAWPGQQGGLCIVVYAGDDSRQEALSVAGAGVLQKGAVYTFCGRSRVMSLPAQALWSHTRVSRWSHSTHFSEPHNEMKNLVQVWTVLLCQQHGLEWSGDSAGPEEGAESCRASAWTGVRLVFPWRQVNASG